MCARPVTDLRQVARSRYPRLPHMHAVGLDGGGSPLGRGAFGFFECPDGQGLEFAEQLAELAVVVEPLAVALFLVWVDRSGDGLAVHGAGPAQVGPVWHRRVALAAAAGLSAAGGAAYQAAGEREADLGQRGADPREFTLVAGGSGHGCIASLRTACRYLEALLHQDSVGVCRTRRNRWLAVLA